MFLERKADGKVYGIEVTIPATAILMAVYSFEKTYSRCARLIWRRLIW